MGWGTRIIVKGSRQSGGGFGLGKLCMKPHYEQCMIPQIVYKISRYINKNIILPIHINIHTFQM